MKYEKDKYRIFIYIYIESRKIVLTVLCVDIKQDTDRKNRLLDTVGEGEGGMI